VKHVSTTSTNEKQVFQTIVDHSPLLGWGDLEIDPFILTYLSLVHTIFSSMEQWSSALSQNIFKDLFYLHWNCKMCSMYCMAILPRNFPNFNHNLSYDDHSALRTHCRIFIFIFIAFISSCVKFHNIWCSVQAVISGKLYEEYVSLRLQLVQCTKCCEKLDTVEAQSDKNTDINL